VPELSGSVTVPGTRDASGSCPAGYIGKVGLWWWRQTTPHHSSAAPAKIDRRMFIAPSCADQRPESSASRLTATQAGFESKNPVKSCTLTASREPLNGPRKVGEALIGIQAGSGGSDARV